MAILNNSPSLELNEIIAKLLNNKFLSDCVFTFDNEIRVVQAHSFLLRVRSIEFEKQFKSSSDNDLKLIPIPKHSYESFLEFVRFIYTDKCNITQENVLSILELAVKYRVPKLENIANEYIIEKELSCSSKLKLYEFCVNEKYELLQSWISVDIGAQLALILNTESFLEMDPDTLEEILKMDYVGTVTNPVHELSIFKALMIWISHYSTKNNIPLSERRSKFDRLIRAIRFPVMPISELNAILREHDQILTKLDFESFFTSTNSEVWNFNNRKVYDCKATDDENPTNPFSPPFAALGNDCQADDEDMTLVPPVMVDKSKTNPKDISNNIQPYNAKNFKTCTGDNSIPNKPINVDKNDGFQQWSIFNGDNSGFSIQPTKTENFNASTWDDSKIKIGSSFGLNSSSTFSSNCFGVPPVRSAFNANENGSGKSAKTSAKPGPTSTLSKATEIKSRPVKFRSTKPIQTPYEFKLIDYPNLLFAAVKSCSAEPINPSITKFTPDKDLLINGLWIKASSRSLSAIIVTCNDAEVLKLYVEGRKNDVILSFGESIRIEANMQCKIVIDGLLGALPSLVSIPRDVIRKDIAECLKDLEVGEKVAEIFFQIPSDN